MKPGFNFVPRRSVTIPMDGRARITCLRQPISFVSESVGNAVRSNISAHSSQAAREITGIDTGSLPGTCSWYSESIPAYRPGQIQVVGDRFPKSCQIPYQK